jgi:hypothetical protein
MIRAHQLVDAIMRDEIQCPNLIAEEGIKRRQWLRQAIVPELMAAHKFDITAMAKPISEMGNIPLTGDGGLIFPFDRCYIEFEYTNRSETQKGVMALLMQGSTETNTFSGHVFMKTGQWADIGFSVAITDGGYGVDSVDPEHMNLHSAGAAVKWLESILMDNVVPFVRVSFMLLRANGCGQDVEPAPERLNKKRAMSGACPIFEHRVIRIAPSRHAATEQHGGTHASPAQHWRRGHVRTMRSGKQVNVRPCLVGNLASGFVSHDYRVCP